MKNLLTILIFISLISCESKDPKPRYQAEIIYPVINAFILHDNLYFTMPDGIQFVGINNPKNEYTFFYNNEKIDFKVRKSGTDYFITFRGEEFKALKQIGAR